MPCDGRLVNHADTEERRLQAPQYLRQQHMCAEGNISLWTLLSLEVKSYMQSIVCHTSLAACTWPLWVLSGHC